MATQINWLIIAEKESQAQDIAKGIFDKGRYSGNTINGGIIGINASSILPGTICITRAQGHLYKYKNPEAQHPKYALKSEETVDQFGFKRGGSWKTPKELFEAYPIVLNEQNIKMEPRDAKAFKIASNIKTLFQQSKNIIVATDGDPEGEMIFQQWYRYNFKQPLPIERLHRVLISSLDPVSIKTAFNTTLQSYASFHGKLGQFYQSLKPRGFARALLDYEFGMTFYVIGNSVLKQHSHQTQANLKMWGRIKNTILYHVRSAELKHDAFKPSNSYRIDLVSQNGVSLKSDLQFNSLIEAQTHLSQLANSIDLNNVTLNKSEREVESLPPSLFGRDELLIAVDKTVKTNEDWGKVLQTNYEHHKILSYPRTDSQHITDIEFESLRSYCAEPFIVELINNRIDAILNKYDQHYNKDFEYYYERPSNKKWVDPAKTVPHYALIPNFELPLTRQKFEQLSQNEQRLYLVDLFQTAALFLSNAVDLQTAVYANILNNQNEPIFKQEFSTVKSQGFRVILNNLKANDTLPQIGTQSVKLTITTVPAKQPSLLTISSLIAKLKSRNEGTSATRDKIVQDMIGQKALIVDRKTKSLRINPNVTRSVDYCIHQQWIEPDMTARWQVQIDNIQNDQDAIRFINQVRQDTKQLCDTVRPYVV